MNEVIFPETLQSSSELNLLLAIIKEVCAQQEIFVYRQQAFSPLLFVIHGGWLQSRLCLDGVIYRAISTKKLAHHFYSTWLPLHQACIARDSHAYLAARANLLLAALTDGDSGGKKAAFWGGLSRIEWTKQSIFNAPEENAEDTLLSSLAYQFGVQIFWGCHTAFSLQQSCASYSKDIGPALLLLKDPGAWIASTLSDAHYFPELPVAFRQQILHATARDFIAAMLSLKEVNHA